MQTPARRRPPGAAQWWFRSLNPPSRFPTDYEKRTKVTSRFPNSPHCHLKAANRSRLQSSCVGTCWSPVELRGLHGEVGGVEITEFYAVKKVDCQKNNALSWGMRRQIRIDSGL